MRNVFAASLFRKRSGTTQLENTINRVFEKLALGGFAGQILGGFALQEYGYQRYTDDVDVVVDHLEEAREYLGIRGFKPVQGNRFKLIDRENGVEVELLPGGKSLGVGQLPLPLPTEVSRTPKYLSLHDLFVTKFVAFISNPVVRAKDQGDIVELMKVNKPNREFLDDTLEEIKTKYRELWDALRDNGVV